MAFSQQFLDELKARIGVAEVVARKVKLTRRGRDHIGLCPFHREKTPSFHVYDDHYHCFGCNAHGGALDFIMNTEGLEFREAVARLAAEVNLPLPDETPQEREREKRRQGLHEVVETAAAWFERTLRMPEGRPGLDYLRGRGLDDETIGRFRLGFAPDARGALKALLAREGVDEPLMIEAGLLVQPDDGRPPYDRFRGRVMFPIDDRRGRVVGFGGRVVGDGEPKYLNSPETPLFHKGAMLYGWARAAAAAREAGRLIVTEGYMDVIALARAGLAEAVAPLGTALTEDQIRALWRLADEPVLCFDGDAAGQRAAARAAENVLPLLVPGKSLRFAVLPAGDDPDSLIARDGRAAMKAVLAAAEPLSEVLWRLEAGHRPVATPEARAALDDRLRRHALRIQDETVRRHFLDALKDRLWQAVRAARGGDARGGGGRGGRSFRPPAPPLPVARGPGPRLDFGRERRRVLLAIVIRNPALFDEVEDALGGLDCPEPDLDKLRQEVLNTLRADSSLDSRAIEDHLRRSGFSETLDPLLSGRFIHASFVARDGGLEGARRAWRATVDEFRRETLQAEIRDVQKSLADDSSAETMDRLRALKAEEERLVATMDGDEANGSAAGGGVDRV